MCTRHLAQMDLLPECSKGVMYIFHSKHLPIMILKLKAMFQMNVSPVFKKGKKYDAGNYRPVLLTCICCKTLEHIFVRNKNMHIALASILADCQHGFKSGRSCARYHQQPGWCHESLAQADRLDSHGFSKDLPQSLIQKDIT